MSRIKEKYPDEKGDKAFIERCKINYFPKNLSKIDEIWYKYMKNYPNFPFNLNKYMLKKFFETQNLIINDVPSTSRPSTGKPLKIRKVKTLYSYTYIDDNLNTGITTKNPPSKSALRLEAEKSLELPLIALLTQNRNSVQLSHLYPKNVMGLPLSFKEYFLLRMENLITSDSGYNFNYKAGAAGAADAVGADGAAAAKKDYDSQSVQRTPLPVGIPTLAHPYNIEGQKSEGSSTPEALHLDKEFRIDVTTHYNLFLINTN